MALSAQASKIIIIVNLVGVFAGVGLFGYAMFGIKPAPLDPDQALTNLLENEAQATRITPVKIKKQTINIYSPSSRLRFLDIEMDILVFAEAYKAKITKNESIILDALVDIGGNMEASELSSVSGKMLLEARLRQAINQQLGEKIIKEIFFSHYVVQ
jgi:flagellar basal body-associated protein FliL